MTEKIVDIVAWAVSQIQQNKFDSNKLELLEEKGFTPKEISIAFSWLSDKINTHKPNEFIWAITNPPKSFRFFSSEERNLFTDEAYDSIIKLMSVGIIRPSHIDAIIEKAEIFGIPKINNDMIRQFVAYFMLDIPTPDENLIRLKFCGDENIN